MKLFSQMKRPGATAAAFFSLALGSVVLLCGAGSVPVENFAPQGAMQSDLNAGGHSLTNIATVSAANVAVSGTLTAAHFSGTITPTQISPSVGAGSGVLAVGTDTFNDVLISTAGTTSGIYFQSQDSEFGPPMVWPVGPVSGNIIFYGDSLVAGVGTTNGAVVSSDPFAGQTFSMPDQFWCLPMAGSLQIFNLGISGQTAYQGYAQYGANPGSTTVVISNNSSSATVTGSTSGMSGTMAVYASGGGIPYATTATISGSTLSLSKSATASGTVTLCFAMAYSYGEVTSFPASAHILSETVTGVANTWFVDEYGTNCYYLNGVTASGAATTASGTITGLSVVSGSSVGGATITGVNGYNAWGGTGSGNGADFTSLGTVTSASSSQVVVSNPGAVLGAMTTFKFTPQINGAGSDSTGAFTTNYLNTVNAALADGDHVMIETLVPFVYSSSGYQQGQYDENRLLVNAWLKSTFGTGTYTNSTTNTVTLCDVGNLPQFQYTGNATYQNYRNQTGTNPHINNPGYSLWAKYFGWQFFNAYIGAMQGWQSMCSRAALNAGTLPPSVVQTYQNNNYTGNFTQNYNGSGTITGLNIVAWSNGGSFSLPSYWGCGGSNGPVSGRSFFIREGGNGFPANYSFQTSGGGNAGFLGYADSGETHYGSAAGGMFFYMPSNSLFFENGSTDVGKLDTSGNWWVSGALKSSATQTNVAGSGSGTATFSEPFQGASYKKVVIGLGSTLSGTATYTFPTVFGNTPVVVNNDAAVTTLGTGTVVVTGTGTLPRTVILEGY
jgi:hypothetical protein